MLKHYILTAAALLMTGGLLCTATSCSDDDDDTNNTAATETEDDDFYGDSYDDQEIYDYIMSQFAELNSDGTLSERTRFFRQLDQVDTTAISTKVKSIQAARQTFLSLLPEDVRTQVQLTTKGDSSDMYLYLPSLSTTRDNAIPSLHYSEKTGDANTWAVVKLPSQGSYTKIANTLSMVKSFGTNADIKFSDYVGKYKVFNIPVIVTEEPCTWNEKDHSDVHYYVKMKKLHMLCYNLTDDDVAQYLFFAPHPAEKNLTNTQSSRKDIVCGAVYADIIGDGEITNATDKSKFDVLKTFPSHSQLSSFVSTLNNIMYDRDKAPYFGDYFLQTCKELFPNDDVEAAGSIGESLFEGAQQLSVLKNFFAYFKADGFELDDNREVEVFNSLEWDKLILQLYQQETKVTAIDKAYELQESFLANIVYSRDENDQVRSLTEYYRNIDGNEWVVVDWAIFPKRYMMYMHLKTAEDDEELKKYGGNRFYFTFEGKNLNNARQEALPVIYFHDEQL